MEFGEILTKFDGARYSGSHSLALDGDAGTSETENYDPGPNQFDLDETPNGCRDFPPGPDRMPSVAIGPRNILPALDAYGHPRIPPHFPRPVRWMVWSTLEHGPESDVEVKSRPSSSDSFGRGKDHFLRKVLLRTRNSCSSSWHRPPGDLSFMAPIYVTASSRYVQRCLLAASGKSDLTTVKGIKETSARSVKLMEKKCQDVEGDLRRITEKLQAEKVSNIRLLEAMSGAENQTMARIGDVIRNNDDLQERIKELNRRMIEIEEEGKKASLEAEREREAKIKSLLKVIKERDDSINQLTDEIRYLRNFAEDKDRVEASVRALRSTALNRYQQQLAELEGIYQAQEEEQRKLQGLAADRLLALTEQSYNKVLDNLDDDTMAVFYKHCQVQDAINVWLERDKALESEKAELKSKLNHVVCRRETALKYLRKANVKLDIVYQKVRAHEGYCNEHESKLARCIEKYERESSWVFPMVQKRLRQRNKELRELDHTKTVRRAEVMRLKQLGAIVEEEQSTMEEAFVWAINYVMEQAGTDDVDELRWSEREMVLRRVFVLMNMENKTNKKNFAELAETAQKYASSLENDPQRHIQSIANRRAEKSEKLHPEEPLADAWLKFGFLEKGK